MIRARRCFPVALALLAAALSYGCNRAASPPAEKAAPTAPTPAPTAAAEKTYGAPLAAQKPMPITALLAAPEQWKAKAVTIEGKVRKACTRKGCWMEVAASDAADEPGAQGCRVTFKDYGFFVPLDAAGSSARVQGIVEVDTLSASMVRHYEEEGAVFPGKKPDGTAPEVRIVASGVVLSKVN